MPILNSSVQKHEFQTMNKALLFISVLFSSQQLLATSELDLSNKKTIIPSNSRDKNCQQSQIKPWSFATDLPIESPCKMIRTKPPIEIGPKLLGLGKIKNGFRLPSGAVWQPALYLLGSARTAFNTQKKSRQQHSNEVAVRADVFFNLQLSATERVLLGLTPFNKGSKFSRYQFSPGANNGYTESLNSNIDTFWVEGDIGELLPNHKNQQRKKYDMAFSFGRQVIAFQDSVMMNDAIDALVLVKNNMHIIPNSPSTRLSAVYGWNNINRADGLRDDSARFYGLFSETDTWKRTIEMDIAYMTSNNEADGGFYGFSSTQRMGHWNSTLRLNGSFTALKETKNMRNGTLLTLQLSRNLKTSHNVYYVNFYAGFDQYRAATKDQDVGSSIGLIGISFASPGLGNFNSALSDNTDNSYGLATGYQWFFNRDRSNFMLEFALKQQSLIAQRNNLKAISLRFQKAISRRWLWQLDAYVADDVFQGTNYGLRSGLGLQF